MYRIAICDDDTEYMELLQGMIRELNDQSLDIRIDLYTGGKQFVWDYQGQYDFIIMDIQMPDINGNAVAEEIRKKDMMAVLAFCTGEVQPSTESFKVQPYRYIMKDFDDEMIRQELYACLQEMVRKKNVCQLVLTSDGELWRIPITKIVYLNRAKRGCEVWVDESSGKKYQKIITRRKLEELYEELRDDSFVWIHRSYLVNISYIVYVKGNYIRLDDGTELNVSRSKKEEFHKKFGEYLGQKYRRDKK